MNGLTVFVLLVAAAGAVLSKNLCPVGWSEYKGECLYFSHDSRSWNDAQRDCRSRKGYLATDDSADKHFFVRQVLSALKNQNINGFYLGSDDFAFEGQWRWQETGMPVQTFSAWGTGMPAGEAKHNCMQYDWQGNDIVWIDQDCSQRRRYICEKQSADFRNATQIIG